LFADRSGYDDLVCDRCRKYLGIQTTYGSAVFKDFVPEPDATIVTKLRMAGAVDRQGDDG
jgi:hypothetical protein